ncbi:MAG: hypothetical protein ACE5HO_13100, partial [bacterium]
SKPHYNRVEGLFLNFGLRYRPLAIPRFQIYGDAGWGFENQTDKKFRFNVGTRKDFFEFNRLSIGAEVFKRLDSADNWLIGDVENSLAAFFLREDFKDYYGTEGFKFFVEQQFAGAHIFRLEVGRRTIDALRKNTNWSVFGGDRDFDNNPTRAPFQIGEGDETNIRVITAFDWRDNPLFPLTGWYFEGIYEHTSEDFDTDGLFLTLKRFQPSFGNQRIVFRTILGTRHGSLADQYITTIGGIGGLRGFDDKELSLAGNRVFMFNANYLFGGDVLQRIPLTGIPYFGGFWSVLSLGIFVDTGWADVTDPGDGLFDGFGDLTFDNLKTDVGLSIMVLEGIFRMDVAKRTDRSNDDFRFTFRLLEKF